MQPMLLYALPVLMLLSADKPAAPPWEAVGQDDGISIFARDRPGSDVHEMKAQGMIDAPPAAVWKALRDYDHYTQTMPYTEKAQIVAKQDDGKVLWFYSVINAPMVSRRDYVIKISDDTDYKNGKGEMKVSWTAASDKGPPPQDGIVRVTINDGYWDLQPVANGAKTYATYYLYTDPGGSVPKWIVNKANGTAVPNVFRAIKKVVAGEKK